MTEVKEKTQHPVPIPLHRSMLLHRAYRRLSPLVTSKKTASYFTITLSLLSLSFFGLFAVRPTLITAVSLMKNVADLKKLNVDYENKISTIIHAQSEYERIRESLPLIDAALPTYASLPTLAQALERYASRSGITLSQLQIDGAPISKRPRTQNYQKFSFNLIAHGEYEQLVTYLQHILNWKRIVTVESLEFSPDNNAGTESGALRLTVRGTTYYEP